MSNISLNETYRYVRLTRSSRVALENADAAILPEGSPIGVETFTVSLKGSIPDGLIAAITKVIVRGKYVDVLSLRMVSDAEYAGEFSPTYYWQSGEHSTE